MLDRGYQRWFVLSEIALLTGSLSACIEPAEKRYEQRLYEVSPPVQHAIHNQRLREIMRELERLFVERLPKGMNVQLVRKNRVEAVSTVTRAMAESAAQIPEALSGTELNDKQREEFLWLAQSLREHTMALSKQAAEMSLDELRGALHIVQEICTMCHGRFQILSMPDVGPHS